MERSILKPLRTFYAPEDELYYIAEWCALSSNPARMEATESVVYKDLYTVEVYCGASRLYLNEVEDLDQVIQRCAAVGGLRLGGNCRHSLLNTYRARVR